MSKTFSTLLFSFLLLFQIALFADEANDVPEESSIEEITEVEAGEDSPEPQEVQEPPVEEPQDAPVQEAVEKISEAQREADAAEAAELQEVGEGEEPSS